MKKHYSFFSKSWARVGLVTAISIFPYLGLQAQTAPAKLWDKSIGGGGVDQLTAIRQTTDGGYILGGNSDSGISGDKSQGNHGGQDYWVVKTDASGVKTWDKTFGGTAHESFRFIQQTTDGGYILAGYSESGLGGDKTQASKGLWDFWVVKIDASGNKQWDKSFGGSGEEQLFAVQQTTDGGYILGGNSKSGLGGDKSQASQGGSDFWVIKLDATGTKTWDKSFGGSADENLYSIRQTADGGYILGGNSTSGISGDKTQASKGLSDYWVVKIDGTGTKTWDKTFGGSADETVLFSIQQTTDGGYILGGSSASGISGDKTEASKGLADYWVVKLDATGTKTWDKTIGGAAADNLRTMQQTADGGYILGGYSSSGLTGDRSQASMGLVDYWVAKLNTSGSKVWDKALGGTGTDNMNTVYQTTDGGFILGGASDTGLNGDKSQASKGAQDYWLVRLAAQASSAPADMGVTAITAANSGCNLTATETITITVNNLGTAAQSNIPVSYKINTGAPVSEVVLGPVAPNTSVTYSFTTKANLSALGNYTIEARTNLTGDALATNDVVSKIVTHASVPNTPAITASGTATLCAGGSVTLTAASTSTGVTYQWFKDGVAITNATSASYIANAAGSYTATAVVAGTCSSPASTATVLTVNANPIAPAVSAGGSLAICVGGSVTLTANSVAGATITWFKNGAVIAGATGNTYTATTIGSYTATANLNGCGSPASTASVVTSKTTPSTPSITQSGAVLTSSSMTNNQWYLNGVLIPGATNRTYPVTTNGAYTVIVTSNGCSSAPSNAVNITNLGVADNLNNLAVSVYPNPSSGMFNITVPKGKEYEITVSDLTGKVVKQLMVKEENTQLNIHDASKGIYLLKIVGDNKTGIQKLVVE